MKLKSKLTLALPILCLMVFMFLLMGATKDESVSSETETVGSPQANGSHVSPPKHSKNSNTETDKNDVIAYHDANANTKHDAYAKRDRVGYKRPKIELATGMEIPRTSQPRRITDVATTQEIEDSWPAGFKAYFYKKYPKTKEGSDHIRRSIRYLEYRAMEPAAADRLHRYSQYVAHEAVERNGKAIPELCWGADTDIATVQAFRKVRAAALVDGDPNDPQFALQGDARWTFTATDGFVGSANNNPVTIRWSFIPDGSTIPDQDNVDKQSDLIARLNTVYGAPTTAGDLTTAPWFEIFESAFNYWAETTGNIYIYEPQDDGVRMSNANSGIVGTRGDVRIGGTPLDGNSNTLAFNYFPNHGDMVIDSMDTTNLRNTTATKNLFRNVIAHEHGHGMGFSHVCPINRTKLMEPIATSQFQGIQFDDILTAVERYGDKFERNGASRTNNTPSTSHNLGDVVMSASAKTAAISDGSDVDLYKFKVPNSSTIDITIAPTAVGSYLEGPQNGDGTCSAGTNFNPSTRQILSVKLLDTDGVTVLAEQTASALGGSVVLPSTVIDGGMNDYYIQVSGGGQNGTSANNAQIYDLNLKVEDAFQLVGSGFVINSESCQPANGAIDPGETINASITITNTGTTAVANPVVTLVNSAGLTITGNATKNLPSLAPGASASIDYTFAQAGDCGSVKTITFTISGGVDNSVYNYQFTLGKFGVVKTINFDDSSNLPDGWSQTSASATANWRIASSGSQSAPNSVFTPGLNTTNIARLESEAFKISSAQDRIKFSHSYNLEALYDGGFLELSINGGAWQDVIAAGGSLTGRGYSGTISSGAVNVWNGNSNGYLDTTVVFPASAIGQTVKLRWVMSNDSSVDNGGWNIDNIEHTGYTCCEGQNPTINLVVTDAIAKEENLADTATFTFTASEVKAEDYTINYTLSGTASNTVDYNTLSGSVVMLAGQTSASVKLVAIKDSLAEGDELATLKISASGDYSLGVNTMASATIKDLPFDDFRFREFGANGENMPEDGDFDGDGYSNLLEYALGTDPTESNGEALVTQLSGNPEMLSLTYTQNTNLTDVTIVFESSDSLVNPSWNTADVTVINGATNAQGMRTVRGEIPSTAGKKFLRLKVTRNP